MKLLKSKKGFTLIELLVVIGILAVLAAIAIPSVAGLIDRANVSADKTNANEMTNAIERFASEYELYCQDIASGALVDANNDGTPDNMDAAQGRVFNVTKVKDRAGIEGIEKPQTATAAGTTGIAIYRDTKYPVNAETMQAIVKNYTKTSSATFEPKQSDKEYYYSPDCGVVVVAPKGLTAAADLNKYVQSGMDAKGNPLGDDTVWVSLTATAALGAGNAGNNGGDEYNGEAPIVGEIYQKDGYAYRYAVSFSTPIEHEEMLNGTSDKYFEFDGWCVQYSGNSAEPADILPTIKGKPVIDMRECFMSNQFITKAPAIPNTIVNMWGAFLGCPNLQDAPELPEGLIEMGYAFALCSNLEVAPSIPSTASVSGVSCAFESCYSLKALPFVPEHLTSEIPDMFCDCPQLGY